MEAVVRTQVCAVRIMSMVHSSDRRQDCEWVAVRWGSDEPGHEGPPSISACTGEMEDVCCFPPAPFPVPCIYWGAPEWIKERRGRNWIRTWGYLHTFCIEKVQECSKQPLNHPWDRGKAARVSLVAPIPQHASYPVSLQSQENRPGRGPGCQADLLFQLNLEIWWQLGEVFQLATSWDGPGALDRTPCHVPGWGGLWTCTLKIWR